MKNLILLVLLVLLVGCANRESVVIVETGNVIRVLDPYHLKNKADTIIIGSNRYRNYIYGIYNGKVPKNLSYSRYGQIERDTVVVTTVFFKGVFLNKNK